MRGKVYAINELDHLVAFLTEEDEFTVCELLDMYCTIHENDIISGELENIGKTILYNETNEEDFEVYIEDIHGSQGTVRRLFSLV